MGGAFRDADRAHNPCGRGLDGKVESKPLAERPVAARQPTEQKDGKDEEKKD